jgi:hypothetical protein
MAIILAMKHQPRYIFRRAAKFQNASQSLILWGNCAVNDARCWLVLRSSPLTAGTRSRQHQAFAFREILFDRCHDMLKSHDAVGLAWFEFLHSSHQSGPTQWQCCVKNW